MKGCTSAVIFYFTLCSFNMCVSEREKSYFNTVEENVHVPCDSDGQCEEMGLKQFKCIKGICICGEKIVCEKSKPKLTTAVTKIGQNCSDLLECHVEQSICNFEGSCDCIEKTISTTDKRRCLNVTQEIGLPCEEDVQCSYLNGICSNKTCICAANMHEENGICYKTIELGSPCQRNEECPEFSECKGEVCTCSKQYIENTNSSKCLLKAKDLSSPCSENVQCLSTLGFGSTCLKGFCTCREKFYFKARISKCVMDILLDEICFHHHDCQQYGYEESRLKCVLSVCKCKSPYYEHEGNCLSSATKKYLFGPLAALIFTLKYFIVMQ